MIREQSKKPIIPQRVIPHNNNNTQKIIVTTTKEEKPTKAIDIIHPPIEHNKIVNNSNGIYKEKYNITPYEILLPILLPKEKIITVVMGGEWTININEVAYRFKDNISDNKKDISGYLTYRLFPSEEQNETIHKLERSNTLTVKNDSLLLLSFNLNKYEKMQLSGTVTITINNTSQFSYKDLFTSIGFSGINSLNSDNQIIESQLLAINLVRVNPPLFASLYIKHNPSQSSKDLYTELTKLESLPLLSYSPKLQEIANNLSQDLVNNNAFSQFDSKENGLKKRVQEITNVTINGKDKEVCESIIIMRDGYNIIDAIITILQDELVPSKKNRKNLLSKELRYFGMSQMKHKRYDNIIVIEYSNINFN